MKVFNKFIIFTALILFAVSPAFAEDNAESTVPTADAGTVVTETTDDTENGTELPVLPPAVSPALGLGGPSLDNILAAPAEETEEPAGTEDVIGGADGPTDIVVTEDVIPLIDLLPADIAADAEETAEVPDIPAVEIEETRAETVPAAVIEDTATEETEAYAVAETAAEEEPVEEEDPYWYYDQPMMGFRYEGLVHKEAEQIDRMLKDYIGVPFSDDAFGEIYGLFYNTDWVEYVAADAVRGGESGRDLIIVFQIQENPVISSITVDGNDSIRTNTLLDKQSFTEGSFFVDQGLRENAESLQKLYREKGYRYATVEAERVYDWDKNTVDIFYHVTEEQQYKIRSIVFDGATVFSEKELKKHIESHEKSFFNSGNFIEDKVTADTVALTQYYLDNGYLDIKLPAPEIIDVTEEGDKTGFVNVVWHIDEGQQWYFGSFTFSETSVFTEEEIRNVFNLEAGAVHNMSKLNQKIMDIASMYMADGYIRCMITPIPMKNDETHTVDYSVNIFEGTQSMIEEIRFTGLTKTKPYVFERELDVKVGDVFNRDKVIKSQQNIYNTALIKNIRMDLYPGKAEDGLVIEFNVEEGNQMELQFGATFGGTVDGFPISGFLQWSDKNLAGTGRDLSINTTLSPDTQSLAIMLSDDWVGNKRWGNGLSLNFERSVKKGVLQKAPGSDYFDGRDRDKTTFPKGFENADEWYNSGVYPSYDYLMDYDYYRISVGYNTGYTWMFPAGALTLGGGLSIGVNHASYEDWFDPYDKLIRQYHDRWQFSNRLSLNLQWDGRDLKTNTTKGYVLSGSYTYAGGFLFGLSNYNRLSLSGSAYHSIFHHTTEDEREKHLVLSFATQASFMFDQYWKIDGDEKWGWHDARFGATKYEMLYIDGMNIGRGFSPSDELTDLAFLWNNQIELSYPLALDVLNVEAFASATAITKTLQELESFSNIDWYFAFGAGIRLKIPGFPLGLYIVKNASIVDSQWAWNEGFIFNNADRPGSGLKLVLAISTSIY